MILGSTVLTTALDNQVPVMMAHSFILPSASSDLRSIFRGLGIAIGFFTPCIIVQDPVKLSSSLPTQTPFSRVSELLSGHQTFLCVITSDRFLISPQIYLNVFLTLSPFTVRLCREWVNKWEFWLLLLPLSSLASFYWKKKSFPFLSIMLLIMAKSSIPTSKIHFLTMQVTFGIKNFFVLKVWLSKLYILHGPDSALSLGTESWSISICLSALTVCVWLGQEWTTCHKVEKIKITVIVILWFVRNLVIWVTKIYFLCIFGLPHSCRFPAPHILGSY